MESWRRVWREGIVPLLNLEELEVLESALVEDDPRLLQGATTTPPPLQCVQDWPVEAACALAYCGWIGNDEINTVSEAEEYFAKKCYEIDLLLGEPAACRWFLNWFDDTPRNQMRQELLEEVQLAIMDKVSSLTV